MFVGRKFRSWPSYWHLMLSGGGRANCERLRSDRTPLHFLEQPDSVIGRSSLWLPPSLSPLFSNLSLTLSLILKHHNWHVTRNPPDDNIDHVDLNVNGEDVAVARCPLSIPLTKLSDPILTPALNVNGGSRIKSKYGINCLYHVKGNCSFRVTTTMYSRVPKNGQNICPEVCLDSIKQPVDFSLCGLHIALHNGVSSRTLTPVLFLAVFVSTLIFCFCICFYICICIYLDVETSRPCGTLTLVKLPSSF